MDKRIYIAYLYDFYSILLTKRQQDIFVDYYFNDFSLNEIANKLEITKQGVRSSLVTTEKLLNGYEEKLELYKKFEQQNQIIDEILKANEINEVKNLIIKLKQI